MAAAWKKVADNKGAAGVDGLSIDQTKEHLKLEWPRIREELLSGRYRPSPVRRVSIEKREGGTRDLGIPVVVDRLIQQALLQVIQPKIDPTFSHSSFGFRPGRSAQRAVLAAKTHIEAGHRVVVDIDLEAFFDNVDHDILMNRLARHIGDSAVLRLIGQYLRAPVEVAGRLEKRSRGVPQGGPLSPILANVMLDEVDRLLESRGHRFVRYADDCNVYVRSQRAGERVLGWMTRVYARLHLKVNSAKTAVASYRWRPFLGYAVGFWGGRVQLTVSHKALRAAYKRLRELTPRYGGRSLYQVGERLRGYVPGWKAYFQLATSKKVFRELDERMRHRLRVIQASQWRRGTTMFRELRKLGVSKDEAAMAAAYYPSRWKTGKRLNRVLPSSYFDQFGVPVFS